MDYNSRMWFENSLFNMEKSKSLPNIVKPEKHNVKIGVNAAPENSYKLPWVISLLGLFFGRPT